LFGQGLDDDEEDDFYFHSDKTLDEDNFEEEVLDHGKRNTNNTETYLFTLNL
jgi:hypothetical protein